MAKAVLLALFLLFTSSSLKSQTDCSLVLENAEKLFEQGIIEEIPSLLSDCIKSGLNSAERERAQKLIILSYLFDNRIQQAENAMVEFLRINPEYSIQSGDPAEFTSLFSRFRTFPYLSLGAFLGGNLTSATILTSYGPFDHNTGEGHYSPLPEMQIGAAAFVFLTNRLELILESIYTRNSFSYTNLQYGFAEIYRNETHQKIEIPLSISYDLPGERWHPYFRIGASYGLILTAHTSYRRSHMNNGPGSLSPLQSSNLNIRDRRNTSTLNGIMGAGIKYQITRGFIFFDLRYSYGLSQLVTAENRWDQETVFRYYYADGDFVTDNLSFSLGYRYSFYKSRKL
jgi:hypothetical protein